MGLTIHDEDNLEELIQEGFTQEEALNKLGDEPDNE